MRRREVITLLGGATAWPLVARAQQHDQLRRIGVLMSVAENDPEAQAWLGTFSEGLQQSDWTAGRNIRLDYRWAAPFDAETRQRVGKELVALQLIFTLGIVLTMFLPGVARESLGRMKMLQKAAGIGLMLVGGYLISR